MMCFLNWNKLSEALVPPFLEAMNCFQEKLTNCDATFPRWKDGFIDFATRLFLFLHFVETKPIGINKNDAVKKYGQLK